LCIATCHNASLNYLGLLLMMYLIVAAVQCNVPLRVMEDNCPLISEETGCVISADADQRVEFHISYLLDSVDDWRKNDDGGTDVSLLGTS
jgi:hypothetical protein